jgi:hypothetical protein
MPLTALPVEEARQILVAKRAAGKFGNPDIDGFLKKRYDRDKQLRDIYNAHSENDDRVVSSFKIKRT